MNLELSPAEHDHLFKGLLSADFPDFMELFCPKLAAHLDPNFGLLPMPQKWN